MGIHVAVGLVPVKRFDLEGLHQLQNVSLYHIIYRLVPGKFWEA